MRAAMTAIGALLMMTVASGAQDCRLKQYDTLTLEVFPDHLQLPVTFLATEKKVVLQLDHAANGIDADSAALMNLRLTSMPPNLRFHRGGHDITRIAHVPEMRLGHLAVKDVEFLVIPPKSYPDDVVGDIGTLMFGKVDFELDIAGGKFNLFSTDHCPGNTVYWTKSGFAQVALKSSQEMGYLRADMMLDGHPLTVALSTVGTSRIGMNAMRRIFNVNENSPDLVPVDQDLLGHKLYRYPFKELAADGLSIKNPAILVFDEEPQPGCNDKMHLQDPDHPPVHSTEQPRLARCFGGNDVVLGLSVLRKLRLYVSNKEKMLYLTGADAK
jgi:hypothetical protein